MPTTVSNVVASGSHSGSGNQAAVTVFTTTSDGFYFVLGQASAPANAVQVNMGSYQDSFPVNYPYSLKYYYLASGVDISIQVTDSGGWSYIYTIYSL